MHSFVYYFFSQLYCERYEILTRDILSSILLLDELAIRNISVCHQLDKILYFKELSWIRKYHFYPIGIELCLDEIFQCV